MAQDDLGCARKPFLQYLPEGLDLLLLVLYSKIPWRMPKNAIVFSVYSVERFLLAKVYFDLLHIA
jgi:hypothetical protein